MRTAARFHSDEAGSTVREELKELRPFDRLVHNFARFLIDVVHLENQFCNVNSNWRKLHFGLSGCL